MTLWLPEHFQRRGPQFPGLAVSAGEGQFADDTKLAVPTVESTDPFLRDLAAAEVHPGLLRRRDLIDGEFAILWLTHAELVTGPTAPRPDLRAEGEHVDESEGTNAWDNVVASANSLPGAERRLRCAQPGKPQNRQGYCAQQNQDEQHQQGKLMDSELRDATRGHCQHTHEGAEETEVATRHEAAVGTEISFPDSPQPCCQSAKRQNCECMEPVEPAVYGSDSKRGQHHDVHGSHPDSAHDPMEVAAFGPTQQVNRSKDECIAGSHCVHSDQDGPRGRHTPERSGRGFPGPLFYSLRLRSKISCTGLLAGRRGRHRIL